MKPLRIISILAILLLLGCLISEQNYDYYLFAQSYLLFASSVVSYTLWKKQRIIQAILFITIAIRFNPIKTLGFSQPAWGFIDLLTIGAFGYFLFEDRFKNENWQQFKGSLIGQLKSIFSLKTLCWLITLAVIIEVLSIITQYNSPSNSELIDTSTSLAPEASFDETQPPTIDPLYIYTIGEGVNVRTSPDSKAAITTTIDIGERLYLTDYNADKTWAYVTFENYTGWVSTSLIGEQNVLEEILSTRINKLKAQFTPLNDTYQKTRALLKFKQVQLEQYRSTPQPQYRIGDDSSTDYVQNPELEETVLKLSQKHAQLNKKMTQLIDKTNTLIEKYNSLKGYQAFSTLSNDTRDYRD